MPNMICLAGMPGVGKTTWAKNFLTHHSDYLYFKACTLTKIIKIAYLLD